MKSKYWRHKSTCWIFSQVYYKIWFFRENINNW